MFSARQKIDEDLLELERQLRLQAGEEVEPTETDRPADAYLNTPMVSLIDLLNSTVFLLHLYLLV